MWTHNRLLLRWWWFCSSEQNWQQTILFSWKKNLNSCFKLDVVVSIFMRLVRIDEIVYPDQECFSQFPCKILPRDIKIEGTPFPDMESRINIHKTSAISIDTKKNLRHKSWVSGATLFFLRIDAADLLKI